MITYFKNQIDLAESLRAVIDKYWALKIDENELIRFVRQVKENNIELLYKNDDYTTIVKQKLGIKRMRLLDKILRR